jgi:hypothetical protein
MRQDEVLEDLDTLRRTGLVVVAESFEKVDLRFRPLL